MSPSLKRLKPWKRPRICFYTHRQPIPSSEHRTSLPAQRTKKPITESDSRLGLHKEIACLLFVRVK